MKLLTVCIPCYNSIMEMHKAINSCLLMKDEVEVLIVDRHSHDETLQVAREYEEAYPDTVKVITTKEDVPFLKTALKYSEDRSATRSHRNSQAKKKQSALKESASVYALE